VQMGYRTILVLTGSTKEEDLGKFSFHPDLVLKSIEELNEYELDTHAFLPLGDPMDDTVRLELE
ncbi:MAG: HAD hydrolase-like protein, partial [Rubripirellula sp.]|nr:HAD hydrolase-like protein [Rubripirellula sp.]